MENNLKEALWEGEEIRWSGRPRPFKLLDSTSKSSTILTWIISVGILLAVVLFLVPSFFQGTRSLSDVLVLSIVALFLPGILSARPFLDKHCLEDQTLYAITNFRIIAVIKEEVMYLPLAKGLPVAVENSDDGCGILRFGETVGAPAKKSRTHAVIGIHSEDDSSTMQGLLFYHVDRPEQLLSYLA